jgi:hypothetical protein
MNDASRGTLSCLEKTFARWQYVTAMQQQQQQTQSTADADSSHTTSAAASGANGHFAVSVPVGRNCRKLVKDLGLQLRMPQRKCTYSESVGALCAGILTDLGTAATPTPTKGTNNADR